MAKKHYIIPIFVPHEGCPHDCVFCNQNKITGQKGDILVIEKNKEANKNSKIDSKYVENTVLEYLETINKEGATLEISFFGGTFTAIDLSKQRELLSVAYKFKKQGIINYIRLSTRPDYIDESILNHLKEYEVDIIELGIQSLDDYVLLKSGRGHKEIDVIKASNLIKEYGFTLGHQIMLGLPGDDFKKDIETCKKSIKMKPDICRIYPALTIKDTPMETMYVNNNYRPYTLEEAIDISKVIYKMYIENGVNVIRIGLQPTDNISLGKDVVAGPFHPAFRELVESSIINDDIYDFIKSNKSDCIIKIHPNKISRLYADKKRFFYKLKENIKPFNIKVDSSSLNKLNKIELISNSNTKEIKL